MSGFDRRCDTEVREFRRLEVINGELGRRTWSAEQKGEIVAESMRPGVVVSEVARRHYLTPQQLVAWRHDAKQGRLALPEEAMSFVPVVATADDGGSSLMPSAPATRQIEIRLDAAVI
jgi:transposase